MNFSLKRNQFLQAILVGLGLYVLWRFRVILLLIFITFLLTTVFHPLVAWLKKHRWPTFLAIVVPIIVFWVVLGLIFYILLPPFLHRLADFAQSLPNLLKDASSKLHISANTGSLTNIIHGHSSNLGHYVFSITATVIEIIAGALTIAIMSIYWLVSYDTIQKEILSYFHGSSRRRLKDIWLRIEIKLHHWIKAHIILNTVVALLVWAGMSLLGVPFAGLLAFTAFLLEIIPTAGPILFAIPGIVLGLSESLIKGVIVTLVYIVIQQIESHILSPLLLGKTVELHPIIIIIGLLVGFEIYGILGAFIAVPVALCISSVTDSFRKRPLPYTGSVTLIAYNKIKSYLK